MTEGHTSINEDLLRKYHEAGDFKNLLAIFDHWRTCCFRAEALSRVYLDQMTKQQKLLDDAKGILGEPKARRIVEPDQKQKVRAKKPESEPEAHNPEDDIPIDIQI